MLICFLIEYFTSSTFHSILPTVLFHVNSTRGHHFEIFSTQTDLKYTIIQNQAAPIFMKVPSLFQITLFLQHVLSPHSKYFIHFLPIFRQSMTWITPNFYSYTISKFFVDLFEIFSYLILFDCSEYFQLCSCSSFFTILIFKSVFSVVRFILRGV